MQIVNLERGRVAVYHVEPDYHSIKNYKRNQLASLEARRTIFYKANVTFDLCSGENVRYTFTPLTYDELEGKKSETPLREVLVNGFINDTSKGEALKVDSKYWYIDDYNTATLENGSLHISKPLFQLVNAEKGRFDDKLLVQVANLFDVRFLKSYSLDHYVSAMRDRNTGLDEESALGIVNRDTHNAKNLLRAKRY